MNDIRERWSKKSPQYRKLIEEKYDEYLKAEIAYAKKQGWTDEEIQRLLIDDNEYIVRCLVRNEPTGTATEIAGF